MALLLVATTSKLESSNLALPILVPTTVPLMAYLPSTPSRALVSPQPTSTFAMLLVMLLLPICKTFCLLAILVRWAALDK
jgi:hypothetical protein